MQRYPFQSLSKMINAMCFFCMFMFACGQSAYSLSTEESAIIDRFLRTLVEESEAGYVFDGQKPLCVHGFFGDDRLRVDPPSVALKEGAELWKRIAPNRPELIIHVYDQKDSFVSNCTHILVINRHLFLDTVQSNLPLFQYVLGPEVTPSGLLANLLSDKSTFLPVLKEDKVLIGIVLGYGTQNSISVSRMEDIQEELFSTDTPPFLGHASQLPKQLEGYKNRFLHFTQGSKRTVQRSLSPSFGFLTLDEEVAQLSDKITLPPVKLTSSKPSFIFGLRQDAQGNRQLIENLEKSQTRIQQLLRSPSLAEELLKEVPRARPIFPFSKNLRLNFRRADNDQLHYIVAKYISSALRRYDEDFINTFIETFGSPAHTVTPPVPITYNPEYMRNLAAAQQHLHDAENFFHQLSSNSDMHCIVPKKLYCRVLKKGNGTKHCENPQVTIRYQISDPDGNVLADSLHEKKTIDLNETIHGFAHGVKGMEVGETREIFIHPCLAYGVYTFLEKGIYLNARVTLDDFSPKTDQVGINPIHELELSFIHDEAEQRLCHEHHRQAAICLGAETREFYARSQDVDIEKTYECLQQIRSSKTPTNKLTEIENRLVNRIHWNILFADSTQNPAYKGSTGDQSLCQGGEKLAIGLF